jgi:hypothetical protein
LAIKNPFLKTIMQIIVKIREAKTQRIKISGIGLIGVVSSRRNFVSTKDSPHKNMEVTK